MAADALLDVVAGESQGAGVGLPAQRNVDVGMVSVEMGNGDPLQALAQVVFHPGYQLPGVAAEIEPFAELRRDDQLEQSLVAGCLPSVQGFGDVDPVGGC